MYSENTLKHSKIIRKVKGPSTGEGLWNTPGTNILFKIYESVNKTQKVYSYLAFPEFHTLGSILKRSTGALIGMASSEVGLLHLLYSDKY